MEKTELLIMSNGLENELISFLLNHPAGRFSKNLRDLLIHYLQINMSESMGVMPDDMKDTLFDLYALFAILDKMEDKKNWIVLPTSWIIDPKEIEIVRKYHEVIIARKVKNGKKK